MLPLPTGIASLFAPCGHALAVEVADAAEPGTIIVTPQREQQTLAAPTSASRLGLSLQELPASAEIIDGDLIRPRGDRSIVDAVTRGGGITSVATPGNGLTALAARGFSGQDR